MNFAKKKIVGTTLQISQRELAKEIVVSLVTVTRWESKGLQPQFLTEKKFGAFCKSKGITFEENIHE